jgi:hypothetical protein
MERPEVKQMEPPPGEWLLKLHGEILGPVPSAEIIERMFTGEVDESTEISFGEDGDWRSIQMVSDFHPFLYQAKAKIRADKARAEAARAAQRRRVRSIIKVALGAAALVIISFGASYFLIVSRPWKSGDTIRAWAEKHVPLLSVPSASAATLKDAEASMEEEDDINIDQILIDDAPALVALKSTSGKKKSTSRKRTTKKKTKASTSKPETKTASVGSLSNDEIMSSVYARSNLRRLYACIRSELKRNPEMTKQFTLDFSIKNDGRIGQVRMEDPKLDGGPMQKCFEQKLARLKFRSYSGQVRNVTIPFNVGK